MTDSDTAKDASKRPCKLAHGPMPHFPGPSLRQRHQAKAAQVLAMLGRPEGSTLGQLLAATGWQPHTSRAALTSLRKKGHVITSEKPSGGERIYRIAPGGEAPR
jgi:DNA-binding MarR family transcriptional regulator